MPQTWFRRLRARRTGVIAGKLLAAACAVGLVAATPVAQAAPEQATVPSTTGATAMAASTTAAPPPTCPIAGSSVQPLYLDTSYSFAERAADLVSRMTLPEKVAQLSTNNGPAIPRLGVQEYTYWSEGQHGVNRLGADDYGDGGFEPKATSFPTNFASTMSWDPSLVYAETSAISDEARGFLDKSLFGTSQNNLGPSASDYGSLTYWAPTVNMDRDPRWGRTDEAFGEDPYLVGQMAGAFVDGYQGETMTGQSETGYLKVAATAKHYALNNVEDNRTGISSNVSDTDLRDYYTAQFKDLIQNANVSGLMTSYNAINGTPSVADTYTATSSRSAPTASTATSPRTAARSARPTRPSRAATTGRRPAGRPTTRAATAPGPTRRPARPCRRRRAARRTRCARAPTSNCPAARTRWPTSRPRSRRAR